MGLSEPQLFNDSGPELSSAHEHSCKATENNHKGIAGVTPVLCVQVDGKSVAQPCPYLGMKKRQKKQKKRNGKKELEKTLGKPKLIKWVRGKHSIQSFLYYLKIYMSKSILTKVNNSILKFLYLHTQFSSKRGTVWIEIWKSHKFIKVGQQ